MTTLVPVAALSSFFGRGKLDCVELGSLGLVLIKFFYKLMQTPTSQAQHPTTSSESMKLPQGCGVCMAGYRAHEKSFIFGYGRASSPSAVFGYEGAGTPSASRGKNSFINQVSHQPVIVLCQGHVQYLPLEALSSTQDLLNI